MPELGGRVRAIDRNPEIHDRPRATVELQPVGDGDLRDARRRALKRRISIRKRRKNLSRRQYLDATQRHRHRREIGDEQLVAENRARVGERNGGRLWNAKLDGWRNLSVSVGGRHHDRCRRGNGRERQRATELHYGGPPRPPRPPRPPPFFDRSVTSPPIPNHRPVTLLSGATSNLMIIGPAGEPTTSQRKLVAFQYCNGARQSARCNSSCPSLTLTTTSP